MPQHAASQSAFDETNIEVPPPQCIPVRFVENADVLQGGAYPESPRLKSQSASKDVVSRAATLVHRVRSAARTVVVALSIDIAHSDGHCGWMRVGGAGGIGVCL